MNATTTHPSNTRNDVVAGVESSCRLPLMVLFISALSWLLLATVFGLIASLKFHMPQFLAGTPNLTYGRVTALQADCALYGFGLQAGMAFILWLFVRLGRTPVASSLMLTIAASFFNFAITLGVVGVFCGDSTGFQNFEFPPYAAWTMWISYIVMGVIAILTYSNRDEQQTYPSQWFGLTSLFWFAWICATALLLLLEHPVRGVVQSSINWWYVHNLHTIVLGFTGLAAIFYFIPKLLGRQLFSRQLALFAFWTLALFGSWGAVPNGAPLPEWIPAMSTVGIVLTAIPIIAIVLNIWQTIRGHHERLDSSWPLKFTYVGLMFWVIASVQLIVGAVPSVSSLTDFTWFTVAQKNLWVYGFFALTMFGAMYYALPRVMGIEWPSPAMIKAHFWLTFLGVVLSYIALLVGGIAQGYLLTNPQNSFAVILKTTLMAVRVSTLGDLLLVVGQFAGLLNLVLLAVRAAGRELKISKS
ncbi:MAG: Cytochrome c oxidase subunit [Verrucomicrobiales bacterium]|nr:Cytochrome c oxidase subunit [Verrucomicrobiales bacterium]